MGYRQLDFAEACQISGTSLKKYMKDQLPFSVELLKKFAELLDCSTDYLLGQAETPQKEIQTLKEQTHLSDGALLFLKKCDDEYLTDDKNDSENILNTISLLLENPDLIRLLKNWLYFDENASKSSPIIVNDVVVLPDEVCGALFLTIQEKLCKMKYEFKKGNR